MGTDSKVNGGGYSIGTVSRMTGLTTHTIRAWERRFGVVVPQRSDGGTRRYSEDDVARLLDLALAVAAGHRIGDLVHLESARIATLMREGTRRIPQSLPVMTRAEIDALDFGVVQLDDQGHVILYNEWESRFSGFSVDRVQGRSFFGKIAPCTNNDIIYGAFKRGVESGTLDTEIEYTFTYRMEPQNVRLHLYRDPETRTNWLLVRLA